MAEGNSRNQEETAAKNQQPEEVSSSRSVLEVLAGGGFVAGLSANENQNDVDLFAPNHELKLEQGHCSQHTDSESNDPSNSTAMIRMITKLSNRIAKQCITGS
ncbi:hypothetical protein OIU77_022204 [Salix suchowensis]|uniref:Uncharacterized protein n=1 Tax=Salix suchowensis TaxID=1278906 RepID=A0ABQ9BZE6_9ROSI|nr:hypothetical protein OIU77_022204 [Salix suchowensis]